MLVKEVQTFIAIEQLFVGTRVKKQKQWYQQKQTKSLHKGHHKINSLRCSYWIPSCMRIAEERTTVHVTAVWDYFKGSTVHVAAFGSYLDLSIFIISVYHNKCL